MNRVMFFVLLCTAGASMAQPPDSLIILGKRQFIQSKILNEKREFWVYLPSSYNWQNSKTHNYPVLYLLDGDTFFIQTAGIVDDLGWCMVIPEMIIVAVIHNDRLSDLLPTHTSFDRLGQKSEALKNSGHADDFLKFMSTELFGYIDSRYRTMPYRILMGHSSAGLTALYSLQKYPTMFHAYIVVDPGALTQNEYVMEGLGTFLEKSDLSNKKLFISSANNQSPDEPWENVLKPNKDMLAALEKDTHSHLDWKYQHYPNDNHASVYVNSFYDAMRFIFRNYTINFLRDRFRPELVKSQFQKFSEETHVKFIPPEYNMSRLGREVLSYYSTVPSGLDAALNYFKTNVDNFPKSVSSWLELGLTYLRKGDKPSARKCFEKVLELEPTNEVGKSKLEEIK